MIFFTSWQLEYFCCEVPERVHFFIVLFLLSIQCSIIYCLVIKLYHIKIKYLNSRSLVWAFYARFQNLIRGMFSSCDSIRKNIIFAILLSVTSHYCRWSCTFIAMKDSHREKLQEQLTKLIMKVLVSNPQLHYYQVSGLSKIRYLFNRSKAHDSGYTTAFRGTYWYLYRVYCWKPAQINSGMDTETVSASNIKYQRAGNTPNILILANRLKSKLKSHISLQILSRPPPVTWLKIECHLINLDIPVFHCLKRKGFLHVI